MATTNYVQIKSTYLEVPVSETDTEFILHRLLDGKDQPFTMTDFGSIMYGTIDAGSTYQEIFSFTGIVQNSNRTAKLTGVVRGLSEKPPYGADGFKSGHSSGAKVVLGSNPQVFVQGTNYTDQEVLELRNDLQPQIDAKLNAIALSTDITLGGATPSDTKIPSQKAVKEYADTKVSLDNLDTAVTLGGVSASDTKVPSQKAVKEYADNLSFAGVPLASQTVKGRLKLSVTPADANEPKAVGDNDPRVPSAVIDSTQRDETPADDAGKVVKLEADGFFSPTFLNWVKKYNTGQSFSGAPTPVALVSGLLRKTITTTTPDTKFLGFTKKVIPGIARLGTVTQVSASTTLSFDITSPAGTNRLLVLTIQAGNPTSAPVFPTVTANSSAMSKINERTFYLSAPDVYSGHANYVIPLGTSSTSTTTSISLSSFTYTTNFAYSAIHYQNVDQTTPITANSSNSNTTNDNNPRTNLTKTLGSEAVIYNALSLSNGSINSYNEGQSVITSSIYNSIYSTNINLSTCDVTSYSSGVQTYSATLSTSSVRWAITALELKPSYGSEEIEVFVSGVVTGFSGLTVGEIYTISPTRGAIQILDVNNYTKVGVAISTTELLITR